MAKKLTAPKGAKTAPDSNLLDRLTTVMFVLFVASLVLSRALSG